VSGNANAPSLTGKLSPQHSALSTQLRAELAHLEARGLRRERRTLESPQSAHAVVDGRAVIAFCSNDYLGLAADPRLIAAAQEGAARFGVGAGASHLVLGHTDAHQALEATLARFVRLPRALLFSTGYMANLAIVTALVGRDDAVFADKLNHASLNDAALLSRAEFKRYRHGDLDALGQLLAASKARRKLVVTDAVFSMDGDLAQVPELLALCERHDAALLLDDAHGFGVLGAQGRGVLAHFGIASERIIYMATLGKAAGVFGAFVAGADDLVENLVQRARPYIYTTAMPALLAHAVSASLEIIEAEEARRERLTRLIALLKQGAAGLPWTLMPSPTAIQPLVIGANAEAVRISAALADRGILVPAIRPPTVPAGTARLRISLSAAHSTADVEALVQGLHAVSAE
jgi:8-amino-7-oxononanoate synthase